MLGSSIALESVEILLEAEVSDEVLDDWVVELDVGDLDLRLLWDEVHLPFSLLLRARNVRGNTKLHLPPPGA